jgi:hypothetical protein
MIEDDDTNPMVKGAPRDAMARDRRRAASWTG